MTTLLDGTVVDESKNAVHFFTPADCLTYYGRPRVVKSITIHHWGNLGQRFEDVVHFLCTNRPANPTSAHVVIQDGRATSIISPDNAAFHTGTAEGNATSIGLELRPEATDGDYKTAAAYIYMLRSIYGDIPLVKHSDWFATACPGKWDLARLDKMARSLTGGTTVADSTPKDIAEAVWATNIQQYKTDAKTPLSIKSAAFILGNISQFTTRILAGQAEIKREIASLRADVTNAAREGAKQAFTENLVKVDVTVQGKETL